MAKAHFLNASEAGVEHAASTPGIKPFPAVPVMATSDNDNLAKDGSSEKTKNGREHGLQDDAENREIVWHYLTFEHTLPHPATIHPTRPGQESPPECPNLVKFTNPFDWSHNRKSWTIWVACVIAALTASSAGAYSPGVGQMTREWNVGNVAALVGISTFTFGMSAPC